MGALRVPLCSILRRLIVVAELHVDKFPLFYSLRPLARSMICEFLLYIFKYIYIYIMYDNTVVGLRRACTVVGRRHDGRKNSENTPLFCRRV